MEDFAKVVGGDDDPMTDKQVKTCNLQSRNLQQDPLNGPLNLSISQL